MNPCHPDDLARDTLHRALDKAGDEVEVSVSRESALSLARLVDTRARGQEVALTRGDAEVTPAEASELLGTSSTLSSTWSVSTAPPASGWPSR